MLSREEIICKQKEDDELNILRGKVKKRINTKFEIIEGINLLIGGAMKHVG